MGYMEQPDRRAACSLRKARLKGPLPYVWGKLGVRSRHEAANLLLGPDRGLGMGILALGGEPLEPVAAGVQ